MHLPRDKFKELVALAIEEVPEEFREKLENVEVIVEDRPTPDDYAERGLPPGGLILGLYHGVPLTKRSVWATNLYPDRITIYQRAIEQIAHTPEQIITQVRRTVLHEIAHHFGISDARLRELGY